MQQEIQAQQLVQPQQFVQQPQQVQQFVQPIAPITVGLENLDSYHFTHELACMMARSELVPDQFKLSKNEKSAIPNCVLAINMANRLGADVLMVMQNLYIVHGRPSWSSQFIIACLNGCGRFSPLRFDIVNLGEKTVEYFETMWEGKNKKRISKTVTIQDVSCVAWATEKETGERIESSKITVEMAVKEGWYNKDGSKWQTMPEQMLRYRSASFFGRIYAPEILMGLRSVEEENEIIDVTPVVSEEKEDTSKDLKERILKAKTPDELKALHDEVLELPTVEQRKRFLKLYEAQELKLNETLENEIGFEEVKEEKPKKAKKEKVVAETEQQPTLLNEEASTAIKIQFLQDIEQAQNLEQLKEIAGSISKSSLDGLTKNELRNAYAQRKEQITADYAKEMPIKVLEELENAQSVEQLDQILAEQFEPYTAQMSEQLIAEVNAVYERKTAELTE